MNVWFNKLQSYTAHHVERASVLDPARACVYACLRCAIYKLFGVGILDGLIVKLPEHLCL